MEKNYSELVANRIFFGGVSDTQAAVENEQVDVVVDVRVKGRSTEEQAALGTMYLHRPIADEDDIEVIARSIKQGAREIVDAFEQDKKIFFHCGGGGGRAGVMAVAMLSELGLAESVEEAEHKAKQARPTVTIRPNMKEALEKLYKGTM